MSLKQKKVKIKPRIKLNHNIWILQCRYSYNPRQNYLSSFFFRSDNKTVALCKEDALPQFNFSSHKHPGIRRSFKDTTTLLSKYARLSRIVVT